jgi:hypothetical protein
MNCEYENFAKKYDELVSIITADKFKANKRRQLVPQIIENRQRKPNCKLLRNYTISEEKFREVLCNIKILLDSRSIDNGRRFRASYDFEKIVPRELVFDKVRVCDSTTTRPCCLICKKDLNTDEDRMKYSVYYYPDETQCDTHAFHVDCFLVSQVAKLERAFPVCIATCSKYTGCKKAKKKL